MYVGPQVGSLVDLPLQPRRCQGHRAAVLGLALVFFSLFFVGQALG
jgi:hypothetical protein